VYQNTASGPDGPWVMPGPYSVILTVDGKSLPVTLTVTMDPRVTEPTAVLRRQYDLSMSCYRGLDRLQGMIREVHSLRSQIAGIREKTDDPALRDSLESLDRKLSVSEGNGPPEDVDIIYTTVQEGRAVKQTLNGVQRRLLFVMLVLQNADAPPTDSQGAAVRDGDAAVTAMEGQWREFTAGPVAQVNAMLTERNMQPLRTR